MQRMIKVAVAIILVSCLLSLAVPVFAANTSAKKIKIKGIVKSAGVSINMEGNYYLKASGKRYILKSASSLAKYTNKKVLVTGTLKNAVEGGKIIVIKKISRI